MRKRKKNIMEIDSLACLRLEIKLPNGRTKSVVGRFNESRIKKDSVPDNYHRYAIRHSDADDSVPVTLENSVWVNHFGDFLTRENLDGMVEADKYGLKIEAWEFYV